MYQSQQSEEVSTSPKVDEAKVAVTQTDATSGDSKPAESAASTTSTTSATVSPAVATPPPAAEPMSTFAMFLMWLPFVVAMGLWLYLRGRNQAAERARTEALAAATKKQKKSSRSQSASISAEDSTGNLIQEAGSRSKGNSKKNKKDKLRKKQSAASPPSKKVNQVAALAKSTTAAANSASETSVARAAAVSLAPSSTSQLALQQKSVEQKSVEIKAEASATPVNKAIFEPLRKVTVNVTRAASVEATEDYENDEYQVRERGPGRQRRSNEPTIITTPTKVSGTRFEKLNVPAANAGLSSATNRWPAEASRPAAETQQVAQKARPTSDSRSASQDSRPASANSSQSTLSPQIARGLSAFVKKATGTGDATESTDNNPPADA